VDPAQRLTAKGALEHPFVANKSSRETKIDDADILNGLRKYAHASRFRRACLSMMAWSLSQEERQELQDQFLELDVKKTGSITLPQFKAVLQQNYQVQGEEAEELFATLDTDHDNELCYSEFLAAVLQDRVRMHEHLLRKTFGRFDRDESGTITVDNLRMVLGDKFEDVDVKELICDADIDGNGSICYDEFLQCLQQPSSGTGTPPSSDSESPCQSLDVQEASSAVTSTQKSVTPQTQTKQHLAAKLIDHLKTSEEGSRDPSDESMHLRPLKGRMQNSLMRAAADAGALAAKATASLRA